MYRQLDKLGTRTITYDNSSSIVIFKKILVDWLNCLQGGWVGGGGGGGMHCIRVCVLVYPVLVYPVLVYPVLVYPVLVYPVLVYPVLVYPVLVYPVLIYLCI